MMMTAMTTTLTLIFFVFIFITKEQSVRNIKFNRNMVDTESNPLYLAAIGGIMLGIATSLHYVLKGRVTGMSGILYQIASLNKSQISAKLSILGGLIASGGLFFIIFGYQTQQKQYTPFGPAEDISGYTSYLGFAVGGLLVGFGTKLSNGCTSGHGLCGMARLSLRSFVAVGVFLAFGFGVATLGFYCTLGPLSSTPTASISNYNPIILHYQHLISAIICLAVGILLPAIMAVIQRTAIQPEAQAKQIIKENIISFSVGFIFGLGLLVSGMTRRSNIITFLQLGKNWNPSLLFVLGCGFGVNLLVFNYMLRVRKQPVYGKQLFNPKGQVDWKLVVGAMCFGLGWGIGGLCPGPFIVMFAVFQVQIHVVWFGGVLLGMFVAHRLESKCSEKQTGGVEEHVNGKITPIISTNSLDSSVVQVQANNQQQGSIENIVLHNTGNHNGNGYGRGAGRTSPSKNTSSTNAADIIKSG